MKVVGDLSVLDKYQVAIRFAIRRSDETAVKFPRTVYGKSWRLDQRQDDSCHRQRRRSRHREKFGWYYSDDNNGYDVVNLGIKQGIDEILHAYQEHKGDAIGMSGFARKINADYAW